MQRAPCLPSFTRKLLCASPEGFTRTVTTNYLVKQQEGSVESRTRQAIVNMHVSDLAEKPSSRSCCSRLNTLPGSGNPPPPPAVRPRKGPSNRGHSSRSMAFLEAALCMILPDDTSGWRPGGQLRSRNLWHSSSRHGLSHTQGHTARDLLASPGHGRLWGGPTGSVEYVRGQKPLVAPYVEVLWELEERVTTFRVRDNRSLRYCSIDSPGGT